MYMYHSCMTLSTVEMNVGQFNPVNAKQNISLTSSHNTQKQLLWFPSNFGGS